MYCCGLLFSFDMSMSGSGVFTIQERKLNLTFVEQCPWAGALVPLCCLALCFDTFPQAYVLICAFVCSLLALRRHHLAPVP